MGSRTRVWLAVVGAAAVATAAVIGGLAGAKTAQPTLRTASNATIGKRIVVDGRGLTVYALRPETTRHLLCVKSNGCLGFWPPVTVASAKSKVIAGKGVKGKLGILHRNGFFQVTLAGHPLYRYQGDKSKKGSAAGQGLKTFGGTWHVIATGAAASGGQTSTPTMPTPTTTAPTGPYGY